MTMNTNRIPRGERVLLSGLCGWLAAWLFVTQAADLDPETIGSWEGADTFKEIRSIAVSGHYAYLACGQAGLQILDVRDPARPKAVSRYLPEPFEEWRPPVWSVAVSGDHAYLEVGGRLEVIDIHDPRSPTRVGLNDNGWGSSSALAVGENYAYMAGYAGEAVQVFLVSDPADPRWVATIPVGAYSLATAGKYVYLATWEGLEIWNVATPIQPERVRAIAIPGGARGVALAGGHALLACEGVFENGRYEGAGLRIVDVADPARPRPLGEYSTGERAKAVAVVGHRAFLATDSGLVVIDFSDPAQPQRLGSYESGLVPAILAVEGNTCYFASGLFGWSHTPLGAILDLLDISEPAIPQLRSRFADPPGAADVAVSGRYSYVADGLAGLRVIDISQPAHPASRCWIPVGVKTHAVAVSGRLGCVAFRGLLRGRDGEGAGFMLIDLTNPTNPFRLSRYDTGEPPEDVVLAGNYLYAAFAGDAEEGLQVFDVSDPVRPRPIGSYATGFARGLALSGNHLYVAASGLQVIDISNPTRPTRVGWLGRSDMDAHAIAITGHYACVADRSRGLHVIDISDPTQPRHIGRYSKSNLAAVAVSGNLAWASDELIDISDPRNPRRVAGGLSGAALVMVGQLAYVGEAYGRLKVVDIGRLANPQRVGGNA
jgi:hypothetical protein